MAGLNKSAGDASAFTADFDRVYYWLRLPLVLVGTLFLTGFIFNAVAAQAGNLGRWPALVLLALICAAGIALLAFAVSSLATVLRLPNPALRIDADGIWDKRVTREPIPWRMIHGVIDYDTGMRAPSSIKIDVGIPRRAGLKLVPWTWFAVPRRGPLGWDDPVIYARGLKVPPFASRRQLVDAIVQAATGWQRNQTKS